MKENGTKKRKGREERGWGEMKESGARRRKGREEREWGERRVCVCVGGGIRKIVGRVT